MTYTFTLAQNFDWSTILVTLNATAYDSTNTPSNQMGAFLGGTNPTSYNFKDYGCSPNVQATIQYDGVASAGLDTTCTAGPTTVMNANITIQPPTNTDQSTCTAPPIQ